MSNAAPTQAVAVRKEAAAYLSEANNVKEVAKVLPEHIKAERFMRIVQTAVMKKDQLLQAAAHPKGKLSLLSAILTCAQAGLEPDGRLAHLVPFWNKDNGCYEVQVIFDWKGLVTLGIRNGFDSIYPDMVCQNDQFEAWVENGEKRILHKVDYRKPRGEPYAFYCVTMKGKVLDYEIMTFDETEDIRKKSRSADKGPWITDPIEMRKKCPIRRMAKRWELLPDIRDAIWNDDDTPPPLDQPKETVKPLFTTAEPPKAIEPPPAPVEPEQNAELKMKLTEKLTATGLTVLDLMGFLSGAGIVPDNSTFSDCPPDVLAMVDNQFDDMVKRIKEVTRAN